MNGYICFYNGKRIEVHANTTLEAIGKCAALLKVPTKKQYMIEAVLAEKNGETVTHDPAELG